MPTSIFSALPLWPSLACYTACSPRQVFPASRAHFWLHLGGTIILLVMLYLMFSGQIAEESMFPIAPMAEIAIFVGILLYAYNVLKNLK